jgi:hypothetical protein
VWSFWLKDKGRNRGLYHFFTNNFLCE